jgi:transaldolase
MLFFLDSADVSEIEELKMVGIFDGITTNPSLFSDKADEFYSFARLLCEKASGLPVSIEVGATDYDEMLEEGKRILSISDNVVLKLPTTWDGIKACQYFSSIGREVNMTLCFSANQAVLVAKAGASYVSPFVGRLDDIGHDGLELLEDIKLIYQNYGFKTKILAASIRNVYHLHQVARIGVDVATMPIKIIKNLINHPLTDMGVEKFRLDWINSGLKI